MPTERRKLLQILRGGLWHTTSVERFASIVRMGAIVPEPYGLLEGDRWGTRIGRKGWPFVRTLGGVSLFDFDDFDPEAYSRRYPVSSWEEFVPYRQRWGQSVWIKIDRTKVGTQLISGPDLLHRWKESGSHRHNLMPLIEVAHIGALSAENFDWAFVVGKGCETPESIWPATPESSASYTHENTDRTG